MAIYGIMAHRSAASMFGAKSAPLKRLDGGEVEYVTREQARAEANRLNAATQSPHVSYTAYEKEE